MFKNSFERFLAYTLFLILLNFVFFMAIEILPPKTVILILLESTFLGAVFSWLRKKTD